MNVDTNDRRDQGFLFGLLTGALVGTGLTLWLAPKAAAELRKRVNEARELSNQASRSYQEVTTRVGEAVDGLTSKAQGIRDDMADAVVHGAQEVERIAKAAKTGRV